MCFETGKVYSINHEILNILPLWGHSLHQEYSTLLSFSFSVKAAIDDIY